MKKFGEVYKKKLNESEQLQENKIVNDFRQIYNALLEHYNLTAIHDLNEKSQVAFLAELNQYWSEEDGLSELGEKFLKKKSTRLTESSTPLQKKNFLKEKATTLLNETLRQTDVKYKLYTIIDEMYEQLNAESVNDIMSPKTIANIVVESFSESLDTFMNGVYRELNESSKPKEAKKVNESAKPKVYIKRKK